MLHWSTCARREDTRGLYTSSLWLTAGISHRKVAKLLTATYLHLHVYALLIPWYTLIETHICLCLASTGLQRALRIDGGCGREIRVLNAAGLVISHDMIELLALLPQLRWLNVTDSVLEWSKECPDGVGGEGWPNTFPSINPTFEYASVILSLPSTKLSDAHVIRPRMAESLAGSHDGDEGQREALRFPKLETLHTDRCQGLSHLLR
jgi:hypothetical protein